ncbi:MAG: hypothetical protein ACYCYO_09055 [Bacilli bacterium]
MLDKVAVIDTSTLINFKHIGRADIFDKLRYSLCTTIYVILELDSGKPETAAILRRLESEKRLSRVPLTIEDLVEMSLVPDSKRISDAELSCLVKAREIGCRVFCDDNKAIRFACRYISLPQVIGTVDILIEAYTQHVVSDGDLQEFQDKLAANKFVIAGNLAYKGAEKRAVSASNSEITRTR